MPVQPVIERDRSLWLIKRAILLVSMFLGLILGSCFDIITQNPIPRGGMLIYSMFGIIIGALVGALIGAIIEFVAN